MTHNTQGLDKIVRQIHVVPTVEDIDDIWSNRETDILDVASAKQAILQWVNDEVIGKDIECDGTCDDGVHDAEQMRLLEQRDVLKAHGWKEGK